MRVRSSPVGVIISVALHAAIFLGLPISVILGNLDAQAETRMSLVFTPKEETRKPPEPTKEPKPKPAPKKPKPKKLKTLKVQPRPVTNSPPPATAPVKAEVADQGGIDIPTGRVYEAPYMEVPDIEPEDTTDIGGEYVEPVFQPLPAPKPAPRPVPPPLRPQPSPKPAPKPEPQPAPTPPKPKPPPVDKANILAQYKARVVSKIIARKKYPKWARDEGLVGTVTVAFTVSSGGRAGGVRVAGSSGVSALDKAAVQTVKSASPFPPIPKELGKSSLSFRVRVVYKLH